jgi:malate dehydrogenase (oxaloacetate-decarboxylating)
MAGLHVSDLKLKDMRMVVFGSGTAGTGIADQVRDAIATDRGISKEEAAKQIWCVDKPGLLVKSQGDKLTHAQIPYAREDEDWNDKEHGDLLSVIKEVKPHVLIGTSTKPGAFTQEIVQEMASHVDRPIIFPLSNPTRLHEAQPNDLIHWTKGKALVSTGSPFPPVKYEGKEIEIAECNNSTCFPGIGLGSVLCRARLVSDGMLVAAVKALAAQSPALKDPTAALLPDVAEVREISVKIAKEVIKQAVKEGLAQEKDIPTEDSELNEWVREQMWAPVYRELKRIDPKGAGRAARGELGTAGGSAATIGQ